jgi:hypothetical protein
VDVFCWVLRFVELIINTILDIVGLDGIDITPGVCDRRF